MPDSANSASTTTLTGTLTMAAAARGQQQTAVMAATSGPSGSEGAFTASSLAPSGTWSVSGASGAFGWSYPITLPKAGAGADVMPSVALSYNSSSVDGRISSTNNQSSWIGEGWDYSPGYIERTYRSCRDDPAGTAPKTDDLCWSGPIVTMNLNGQSIPLVLDDTTQQWHPSVDSGQKVELLTNSSGTNGAHNGEYWRVTSTDGIQYYFGIGLAPGGQSADATHSTWTVPVYGAHSSDPCYSTAGFGSSSCAQAWRWNLDYVVDPHGNAAVYYYNAETNYYAANNATTGTASYIRGGTLREIDYGMQLTNGSVYATKAGEQVVFNTAERCIPSSTFTCDPSQFTAANASNWPDTPQDQSCASGASCVNTAPTFWSTKRLTGITTQYYTGTGYAVLDSYVLSQSLPVDGDPELQLDKLVRTGHGSDGSTITMPPVSFTLQNMANRVDGYHTLGPMLHHRLTQIVSETGQTTAISYSATQCTLTNLPASPTSNTMRCFPVYWTPPNNSAPILDYFHKYVVNSVQVSDNNAISPTMLTTYTYIGSPAWHADDNEVTKPAERTYGQFRGYGEVDVRTGNTQNQSNGSADALTLSKTTYYRGMGGQLADTLSGLTESVTDDNRFADQQRESAVYLGDSSTRLSSTITDLSALPSTASRARTGLPALTADIIVTAKSRTLTDVVQSSTVRTVTSAMSYDSLGRMIAKTESGDGVPTVCTTQSYADNTTSWIRNRVAETIVSGQTCPASGTAQSPVLSDKRSYYDRTALGFVGTLGDVTRTEKATTSTHFAASAATYDGLGRPATLTIYSSDATIPDRTTSITYTPAGPGPLTLTTTADAQARTTTTTVDPGRGSVLSTLDAANLRTDATYDALGRLTAVWKPGQVKGTDPATATYSYLLRNDGPSAVTTNALIDTGAATKPYRTSVQLLDAFGRVRQTQTQAYPSPGLATAVTVTDTFYDSHGWVIRTNNRWSTTGAPATSLLTVPDASVDDWTATAHDGYGRATLVTEYHQTSSTWAASTLYGGDRVTVFPPTGTTPTTTITDALGRTTELDQWITNPGHNGNVISGGTAQKTTYQYDALGQQNQLMTAVGTPQAATWTSTYDLAGRILSSTDPDSGDQSRSYDDFGEVISSTDANKQTLSYTYDKLGRKTALYSGTVATGTKLAEWTYDTLQYGKLTSSVRHDPTGDYTIKATGYDAYGNQTGTTTTIPASQTGFAGDYTRSYTYSTTHLLLTEALSPPNTAVMGGLPSETITHSYTPLGLPLGETGYNTYVSNSTYSPWGQPLQYSIGVNTHLAKLAYTYDPQTARVTSTNYSGLLADPQIDNTAYSYDVSGNVTKVVDTEGGANSNPPVRTECYQYDALIQLKQAWTATDGCAADPNVSGNGTVGGPAPYWESWVFDAGGSRTQQTQHVVAGATGSNTITNYTIGSTGHAHALSSTTSPATSYGYDTAGNTISRTISGSTQVLGYDVEGKLNKVTSAAGAVTSYVTSADDATLIRRDPTTTTLFLGDIELTRTNSTGAMLGIRYYSHNGVTLNMRRGSSNPLYLAPDAHGTQDTYINSTTYAAVRRNLDPYGQPIGTQPAWPDAHGFLAQPVDSATGLTDMGAREYDPAVGRFLSVDPVLDASKPQQDNGYNYGWNNPVTNPDPTGMRPADDSGGITGSDLRSWEKTESTAEAAQAVEWSFQGLYNGVQAHMTKLAAAYAGAAYTGDPFSRPAMSPQLQQWENYHTKCGGDIGYCIDAFEVGLGMHMTDTQADATARSVCEASGDMATYCAARWDDMSGVVRPDPVGQFIQDEIVTLGVGAIYKSAVAGIVDGVAAETAASGADVAFGPAPENAWQTFERVEAKGSPLPGYKGGSTFANDGSNGSQILPRGDGVTYREWDVNPNVKGVDRGGERIVTGSNGNVYYTNDHYQTFTQFWGPGG